MGGNDKFQRRVSEIWSVLFCLEIPFQRCPYVEPKETGLALMVYSLNHVNVRSMKEINIDYDLKMFCSLAELSAGLRTCKKNTFDIQNIQNFPNYSRRWY